MRPMRATGPEWKYGGSERRAQTHGRRRPEDHRDHPSEISGELTKRPSCDQRSAPTDQSVHPMPALREGEQSLTLMSLRCTDVTDPHVRPRWRSGGSARSVVFLRGIRDEDGTAVAMRSPSFCFWEFRRGVELFDGRGAQVNS